MPQRPEGWTHPLRYCAAPPGPLHLRPESRKRNVLPRCRTVVEPTDFVGGSQSLRTGAANEKGPRTAEPFFCLVARPEGFEPPTLRFEA